MNKYRVTYKVENIDSSSIETNHMDVFQTGEEEASEKCRNILLNKYGSDKVISIIHIKELYYNISYQKIKSMFRL